MKPLLVVILPPGIISFRATYGDNRIHRYYPEKDNYEEWVKMMSAYAHPIYEIEVNGIRLKQDEWIWLNNHGLQTQEQIESFAYNPTIGWTIIPKAYTQSFHISAASKLPSSPDKPPQCDCGLYTFDCGYWCPKKRDVPTPDKDKIQDFPNDSADRKDGDIYKNYKPDKEGLELESESKARNEANSRHIDNIKGRNQYWDSFEDGWNAYKEWYHNYKTNQK